MPVPLREFFGLAGLTLLCGCDGGDEPLPSVTSRDSAGVVVRTIQALPQDLPEWELGDVLVRVAGSAPEGSEAPNLEVVSDALWLRDGRILVVDVAADRLHLFDPSGAYLESYGRSGEGPEEFSRIQTVTVSQGDTVFAYDVASSAMKVWHPDVGFVRSTRVAEPRLGAGAAEVWRLPSGRLVHAVSVEEDPAFNLRAAVEAISAGQVGRVEETLLVHILDGDSVVAGPIEVEGVISGIIPDLGGAAQAFSPRPFIHVAEGRILYGSGREFSVDEVDSTLSLRSRLAWPSYGEPLSEEEVTEQREDALRGRPESARTFVDATFAEQLLPDRRPAIQRVLVDSEGRLWISRFEPFTPRPHETVWYILDADGTPLGSLSLPRQGLARLGAVRGDRVLLVTRDAVDVSNVQVVRLRSPSR